MGSGTASSSRSPFRSRLGCCICGTKSSSSRFTSSSRYSEHLVGCFGPCVINRAGDLCNACVLCIKRWLQRPNNPASFSQVVDSKKGPGPKHMKEITKRARRREAREVLERNKSVASTSTMQHSHAQISSSSSSSLPRCASPIANSIRVLQRVSDRQSTTAVNNPFPSDVDRSSLRQARSSNHCRPNDFCSPSPVGATFTRAAAAAIRRSETVGCSTDTSNFPAISLQRDDNKILTEPSTPSETSDFDSGVTCACSCYSCPLHCCCPISASSQLNINNNNNTDACTTAGDGQSEMCTGIACCPRSAADCKRFKHECFACAHVCCDCHCFNHTGNDSSPICLTRSQTSTVCCCARAFRPPQPQPMPRSAATASLPETSPVSESGQIAVARRYNRRVVLSPVRMADNAEVDSLLREIMERNNQALNYDSREMHMAVQKELRLRSRTVRRKTASIASNSLSGRASSVSSTDGSLDTTRIASTPSSSISTTEPKSLRCMCLIRRHCVHHCSMRHNTHCVTDHHHLRLRTCLHPSCVTRPRKS